MAGINYYLTSSSKVDSIEVSTGNLIFCEDARTIYLDGKNGRTAYQQIMSLATDNLRITMMSNLVPGFYFVLSTNVLWRFDGTTWHQITEKPSQQFIYGTLESFPRPGTVGIIYYTDSGLYHWDAETQGYVNYCNAVPEWITAE